MHTYRRMDAASLFAIGSFPLVVQLLHLRLCLGAFLLRVGTFCFQVKVCAYSGKVLASKHPDGL